MGSALCLLCLSETLLYLPHTSLCIRGLETQLLGGLDGLTHCIALLSRIALAEALEGTLELVSSGFFGQLGITQLHEALYRVGRGLEGQPNGTRLGDHSDELLDLVRARAALALTYVRGHTYPSRS